MKKKVVCVGERTRLATKHTEAHGKKNGWVRWKNAIRGKGAQASEHERTGCTLQQVRQDLLRQTRDGALVVPIEKSYFLPTVKTKKMPELCQNGTRQCQNESKERP